MMMMMKMCVEEVQCYYTTITVARSLSLCCRRSLVPIVTALLLLLPLLLLLLAGCASLVRFKCCCCCSCLSLCACPPALPKAWQRVCPKLSNSVAAGTEFLCIASAQRSSSGSNDKPTSWKILHSIGSPRCVCGFA